MSQTLVITPLKKELRALLDALDSGGHKCTRGSVGELPLIAFPGLDICCSWGGHGKSQFALQTQFLLDHIDEVSRVLCVGAAGGLAENLSVGDVVVAETTIEHDYKIRFVQRDPPEFPGDLAAMKRIRRVLCEHKHDFRVHFGAIASGDEDIVDPDRARELRDETGAIAAAWEGAGGARACAFSGVGFLEIRGVTDVADNDAPTEFQANLVRSMANVSVILTEVFGDSSPGAREDCADAERGAP